MLLPPLDSRKVLIPLVVTSMLTTRFEPIEWRLCLQKGTRGSFVAALVRPPPRDGIDARSWREQSAATADAANPDLADVFRGAAPIAPPSPLETARGSVKLRAAGLAAAADAAQRLCCLIDCVVTPLPLDRGNSRPEAVAGGALDASVPESACGLPRP